MRLVLITQQTTLFPYLFTQCEFDTACVIYRLLIYESKWVMLFLLIVFILFLIVYVKTVRLLQVSPTYAS
jgi:hypothetical protein